MNTVLASGFKHFGINKLKLFFSDLSPNPTHSTTPFPNPCPYMQ